MNIRKLVFIFLIFLLLLPSSEATYKKLTQERGFKVQLNIDELAALNFLLIDTSSAAEVHGKPTEEEHTIFSGKNFNIDGIEVEGEKEAIKLNLPENLLSASNVTLEGSPSTGGNFEYSVEIEALAAVVKKNANVRFVLAGAESSQAFTKQLRSYITNNKLDEYVKLPGRVHGEEKEKLFNSSDIFVFPTYFEREVFGTVNIEAMSWGLPVISSTEGAIPEIVQDGITGFIVNPKSPVEIANRVLKLVNDSDLREKMGMEGRKAFASKYSMGVHAKNFDRAITFFLDIKKDENT